MEHRSTRSIDSQNPAAIDAGAILDSGVEAWCALVELPLRLTVETMHFASRRLEAQAEHLSALGRCGSVMAAADLQASFLSRAVSDYNAETAILSEGVQDVIQAKAA